MELSPSQKAAALERAAGQAAAEALMHPSIARAIAEAKAARPELEVTAVVDQHGRPMALIPPNRHFDMEHDAATGRLFMIPRAHNRAERRRQASARGRRR